MRTHTEKSKGNKNRLTANAVTEKESGTESTFQFMDNRPIAIAQRKLQEMANNSPRTMQLRSKWEAPQMALVQFEIEKNQDTSPSLSESDLEGLNRIETATKNKRLEAAKQAYIQEKIEQRAEDPFTVPWLRGWGLSGAEIGAMQLYTTSAYHSINNFLRANTDDILKQQAMCRMIEGWSLNDAEFISLTEAAGGAFEPGKERLWMNVFSRVIELITSGMSKLPAPEEEEVSRGTNLDNRKTDFGRRYNELHKPGNIVVDPAFLSTALGVPFAKDSLIVISLPEGHPGRNFSGLSALESESEMLFPPGTGYRIDEVLTVEHEEFKPILERLVPDKTDRENRFKVVRRIFKSTLVSSGDEKRN